MSHGAKKYKRTSITTASKPQLLLMLYEAAIKNVRLAKKNIREKNISAKGQSIGKTHDIINELISALDFNVGGQVATDLERLYNYVTERLIKANLENSIEDLDSIETVLTTLLEGWREAVVKYNEEQGIVG